MAGWGEAVTDDLMLWGALKVLNRYEDQKAATKTSSENSAKLGDYPPKRLNSGLG